MSIEQRTISLTGKIHETYNGHGYMFTWEEPKTAGLQLGWAEAREFCRARCMDLVSLETQDENDFIKERISKGNFLIFNASFSTWHLEIKMIL